MGNKTDFFRNSREYQLSREMSLSGRLPGYGTVNTHGSPSFRGYIIQQVVAAPGILCRLVTGIVQGTSLSPQQEDRNE
jgi:hypothetical protein